MSVRSAAVWPLASVRYNPSRATAFTRDAQREATRDGAAPVDLIDGQLLSDKMKSLKLGVHTKTVEVVQVNKHWFESFSR